MTLLNKPSVNSIATNSIGSPDVVAMIVRHHLEDEKELSFAMLQGRTQFKPAKLATALHLMKKQGDIKLEVRDSIEYWSLV